MRRRSSLRVAGATAVVALVTAAVAAETQSERTARYFQTHTLIAGLASGALVALALAAVVGLLVDYVNGRRWEALSEMAFAGLAHDLTLMIDVLNWLVTGNAPTNEARPRPEIGSAVTGTVTDTLQDQPAVLDPHAVPSAQYTARLELLIERSHIWRSQAIDQIAAVRRTQRLGAAQWAAALVSSVELALVLRRLAHVNLRFRAIEGWLRAIQKTEGELEPPLPPQTIPSRAVGAWQLAFAEAVSAREDLIRAAGIFDPVWRKFRDPAPEQWQTEMDKREKGHPRRTVTEILTPEQIDAPVFSDTRHVARTAQLRPMARDDYRIHVHTDDPGALLQRLGEIRDEGGRFSVSQDGEDVFVYANSRADAQRASALAGGTNRIEHWLEDEERWDDEPAGETWEEEELAHGFAPWEVRVDCGSRHAARELSDQLEQEGYNPIRQWSYLIVGTASREDADALAARLHGQVEPGGELVWETQPGNPFAIFGGMGQV